jgi:hypothetical protein
VRVFAIVFGLLATVAAALLLTVLLAGLGAYYTGLIKDDQLAGNGSEDERHMVDTDAATDEDIEKVKKKKSNRVRPAASGGAAADEPEPAGPVPGPITVIVPEDILFHSIEVRCPSGVRKRGSFNGQRATVQGVPPLERCEVSFQGSEPARAFIKAGETKKCTFNPTVCVLQ